MTTKVTGNELFSRLIEAGGASLEELVELRRIIANEKHEIRKDAFERGVAFAKSLKNTIV